VKFSGAAVMELVTSVLKNKCEMWMFAVSLTVSGCFDDGTLFQGSNKVREIHCCP